MSALVPMLISASPIETRTAILEPGVPSPRRCITPSSCESYLTLAELHPHSAVVCTSQSHSRVTAEFKSETMQFLGEGRPKCRLKLLGSLQLWDAEGNDITPKGAKTQGMLALLAVARGALCERSFLQDKLWSDRSQKHGRDSLKKVLSQLTGLLNGPNGELVKTSGGPVSLDMDLLAIDLFEPELFGPRSLLRQEFLDGIEIRDEEFEDWLRELRATLHSDSEPEGQSAALPTEAASKPSSSAEPFVDRVSLRLGVGLLPVQTAGNDEVAQLIGDLVLNRLVGMLTTGDLIQVYDLRDLAPRSGDRPSDATLQAQCVTLGTDLHVTLIVRRSLDNAVIWDASRTLELATLSEEVVLPTVSELADIMTERLLQPGVLGQPHEQSAAGLVMSGIDHVFRLSDSDLLNAMKAFEDATAQDPRGSYFAWQAFLTVFMMENRQGDEVTDLREQARHFARQALEADPHSPVVRSLLAHVYAFVFRDFDRAFSVIAPLLGRNPDCIMFYDNLAMLHFYTGETDRARKRARQAVVLGRANPFRYSFETSLLMIEAVSGNVEEAIVHGKRSMAIQQDTGPAYGPTLRYLAAAQAYAGNDAEAKVLLARLEAQGAPLSVAALSSASFPVPSQSSREFMIEGLRRLK